MKYIVLLVAVCGLIICSSCSTMEETFVPSYGFSGDTQGEKIEINMISKEQSNEKEYKEFFPKEKFIGTECLAPLTAEGIKVVSKGIQEFIEGIAIQHETQFGFTISEQNFYKKLSNKDLYEFNYVGFEIIRYTEEYNTKDHPSFRLIYRIYPENNAQTGFYIAPVYMQINSTKCRISTTAPWSIIPLFWYQYFMANYDGEVTITPEIMLQSFWMDKNGNWKTAKEFANTKSFNVNLAPNTYSFWHIFINNPWVNSTEVIKKDFTWNSGWFQRVPQSNFGNQVGLGMFNLQVIINEFDASNTKGNLTETKEYMSKNTDKSASAIAEIIIKQ